MSLTKEEITQLAETWFSALNDKWPLVKFLPMLADEGLNMKFPESTLTNYEEFEQWHYDVQHAFFDQNHIIRKLEAVIDGDEAKVDIVVTWIAQTWTPPAARSEHIAMDAYQTWTVKRSEKSGKPIIVTYSVDKMEDRNDL
jgi:hypothetical protein